MTANSTPETIRQALQLQQAGNLTRAEALYRQVLRTEPHHALAWRLLALLNHQTGNNSAAIDYLLQAIELEPDNAELHSNLALILKAENQFESAVAAYRHSLRLNPGNVKGHYTLGVLLMQLNRPAEAADCFETLCRLDPNFFPAHYHLTRIYLAAKQPHRAIPALQQALNLRPDDFQMNYELGTLLAQTGQPEPAIPHLWRAVQLNPHSAPAHLTLARVLENVGRFQEAAAGYEHALQADPTLAEAHKLLGVMWLRFQQPHQAAASFEAALALTPNDPSLHFNLGVACHTRADLSQAEKHYRQAVQLAPWQTEWRLSLACLCPPVMPNSTAIDAWRANFTAALAEFSPGQFNLTNRGDTIFTANVFPPFAMAYHGHNDRLLREQHAALFSVTPLAELPANPPENRPAPLYRIGFLVTYPHEGMFLAMLGAGLRHFDPAQFRLTVFCLTDSVAQLQAGLDAPGVEYIPIPNQLTAAARRVRAHQLDLLFYWETGSDALNYFLPFFRLAPVQCTFGVPVTSGIPQMDYYLSSVLLEPDDAAAHYTEQLVRLDSLPVYFKRPAPPPSTSRSQFGLADDAHIYLCPQNLLKFHPDFDPILRGILQRDPAGNLVLFGDAAGPRPALLARFQATLPDVLDQIHWLPRQPFDKFMQLAALADVVLDTLHYSGLKTSYEILALGAPIVTMPGQLMRSRQTAALYQKMNVPECVAATPQQYVDLAVRLGIDAAYNCQIRQKILAANAVLYEDVSAIRQLEQFFAQAVVRNP